MQYPYVVESTFDPLSFTSIGSRPILIIELFCNYV